MTPLLHRCKRGWWRRVLWTPELLTVCTDTDHDLSPLNVHLTHNSAKLRLSFDGLVKAGGAQAEPHRYDLVIVDSGQAGVKLNECSCLWQSARKLVCNRQNGVYSIGDGRLDPSLRWNAKRRRHQDSAVRRASACIRALSSSVYVLLFQCLRQV